VTIAYLNRIATAVPPHDVHQSFLHFAQSQLRDDRRAVLELTFEGVPMPEITGMLGISTDNGYQLRSRGLKDLAKLKERYDA
jgi:DNA-directed RNA polymerase specialized sigma24 family protein